MTREIKLTKNKVALVDDSDFEWLSKWKWHAEKKRKTFYASRKDENHNTVYMHRLITNTSAGTRVDHRDENGLNNTRINLRVCTNSQNLSNRGRQSNNTSGYKGVFWDRRVNKWFAQIRVNGKQIYLRLWNTPEEAAHAYDEAAKKYHGEYAKTNFE